jgi:hypothetical protein
MDSQNISVRDASTDWVDNLITYFNAASSGTIQFEIGGQVIKTTLALDFISFFKDNKTLLIHIGKDLFKDFLVLIFERKEEEAFNLLAKNMTADDIIARMNQNYMTLDEYNKDRDKFEAAAKTFLIASVAPAIIKILIGLL